MLYSIKQFSKCVFNPMEKELLLRYPALAELTQDIKLLKYVIAMYDPNSPLIRQQRDIRIRKQMAAEFAGYNIYNGTDENPEVSELFTLKNEVARRVVLDFLTKYSFPRVWFQICANEQVFYEYGERMMLPIDQAKTTGEKDELAAIQIKTKLSTDMEALDERIEKGYKKLFGDDEDIDVGVLTGRASPESMAMGVG